MATNEACKRRSSDLQVEEAETQTSGGLVLTSTSREQPTLGKVYNSPLWHSCGIGGYKNCILGQALPKRLFIDFAKACTQESSSIARGSGSSLKTAVTSL